MKRMLLGLSRIQLLRRFFFKFKQCAAKYAIIIFHCRSNGLESRVCFTSGERVVAFTLPFTHFFGCV